MQAWRVFPIVDLITAFFLSYRKMNDRELVFKSKKTKLSYISKFISDSCLLSRDSSKLSAAYGYQQLSFPTLISALTPKSQ